MAKSGNKTKPNKGKGRSGRAPAPKQDDYKSKDARRDAEIENTAGAALRGRRPRSTPYDNPPEDYTISDDLTRAVASFPYGVPLGTRMATGVPSIDNSAVPGIAVLYYAPTVGVATGPTSPINIASERLYTFVRHENSGRTNYEKQDLMIYVIGATQTYAYHQMMVRLYNTMEMYPPENRYMARSLITAMHIDYDDISHNLADLRAWLIMYANKLAQLRIPGDIPYCNRHVWLPKRFYVDGEGKKAQTYMYMPCQFYLFNEGNSQATPPEAGRLIVYSLFSPEADVTGTGSANLLTFSDLTTFGENLLRPLLASEAIAIMSGDILKAYGSEGCMKTPEIDAVDETLPKYSPEVLSQIENAIAYNGLVSNQVTQNVEVGGGYLVSQPSVRINTFVPTSANLTWAVTSNLGLIAPLYQPYSARQILNFHHSEPTPDDVLVATRLMVTIDPYLATSSSSANWSVSDAYGPGMYYLTAPITACGGEVCVGFHTFFFSWASGAQQLYAFNNPTLLNVSIQGTSGVPSAEQMLGTFRAVSNRVQVLSAFDWHPKVWLGATAYNSTEILTIARPTGAVMDIDTYTIIDPDNLKTIHEAVMLKQFWVKLS